MDTGDSLETILKRVVPPAKGPPPEEPEDAEALAVGQMDGRYAALRPANKPLTRLHVVKKDGKVSSFQYHFLDARSVYEGGRFVLLFCGARHWELAVTGHGPRFWAVYDYCTTHRWPYLREAVRDFAGEGETVLTGIEIRDVTPKTE